MSKSKFTKALLVHMRPDQHEFLGDVFGEQHMADGIRCMIDGYMATHNSELEKLKKEFTEITEPLYITQKIRIQELEQEKRRQEDEEHDNQSRA